MTYVIDREILRLVSESPSKMEDIRTRLFFFRGLMDAISEGSGAGLTAHAFVAERVRQLGHRRAIKRIPEGWVIDPDGIAVHRSVRHDLREHFELLILEQLNIERMTTATLTARLRKRKDFRDLSVKVIEASQRSQGVCVESHIRSRLRYLSERRIIRSVERKWEVLSRHDGLCTLEDYRNPERMAGEIGQWARNWSQCGGAEVRGHVALHRAGASHGQGHRGGPQAGLARPRCIPNRGASASQINGADRSSGAMYRNPAEGPL